MDCKSTDHKELDTTERLSPSLRTIDKIEEIPLKLLFETERYAKSSHPYCLQFSQ